MGIGLGQSSKLSLLLAVTAPFCLCQFLPSDAGNYAAKAVTVTGQVSVLRDSQPWAVSVGDMIQVQQLIMSGPDGHAVFQVSDGSTFEVYPNSRVVFRKNLFNWTDLIDLLVGRVRVHIEHLGGQPNPNRVLTPTAVISVRGTTFEVSVDEDGGTTEVDDVEGVVEVQHALLPRGDPVTLQTGESIRVYRNEPLAESTIDKGAIARQALRMMMNAVATMATRSAKVNLPGSSGGVGAPGDSCRPGQCPTGGSGGGQKPPSSSPVPAPPPPPPPLH